MTLKRSLLSLLAARKNFTIPMETHILHDKDWSFETDKYSIFNTLTHPELHGQIKETMISTFYREAPVPLALNLGNSNCFETRKTVEKEIVSALNSGVSIAYKTPKDREIVSIALNLIWKRNNEYEIIGAKAEEWHNAAAEIISKNLEVNEKHLIWRNYQFQHIYDVGQKLLQQAPEKKYALYLSTGYINPQFRRSGASSTSEISRLDDYHAHWDLSDCIIYFITSFYKMNKHIAKHYPIYKPFDHVRYTEEELILEGEKCFRPFENLGGLTYYVDFLKDFTYRK